MLETGFRLLKPMRGTVKGCTKSVGISSTCFERVQTLQENKCVRWSVNLCALYLDHLLWAQNESKFLFLCLSFDGLPMQCTSRHVQLVAYLDVWGWAIGTTQLCLLSVFLLSEPRTPLSLLYILRITCSFASRNFKKSGCKKKKSAQVTAMINSVSIAFFDFSPRWPHFGLLLLSLSACLSYAFHFTKPIFSVLSARSVESALLKTKILCVLHKRCGVPWLLKRRGGFLLALPRSWKIQNQVRGKIVPRWGWIPTESHLASSHKRYGKQTNLRKCMLSRTH